MNRAEAIRFMQYDFEMSKKDDTTRKKGPSGLYDLEKSPRVELSDAMQNDAPEEKGGAKIKQSTLTIQDNPQYDSRGPSRVASSAGRRRGSDLSGLSMERQIKDQRGQSMQSASYLTLSEKQASFCYSMCKMTAIHEEIDGLRHYDKLVFVEFLEMLGRIAQIRFEGTDLQKEPLVIRLEYILESALAILGLERIEVISKEQDVSESDQDY